MAEFYGKLRMEQGLACCVVGAGGRTYTVSATCGQPENLADKIYRFVGAVCDAIPNIFYMGKVHGVPHKAKANGDWVQRNTKNVSKAKKGKKK